MAPFMSAQRRMTCIEVEGFPVLYFKKVKGFKKRDI